MRRFDCFPMRSRFMKNAVRSAPDPAQQLPQHDRADKAENEHRPRLPEQHLNKLVHVRVRHAWKWSSFIA